MASQTTRWILELIDKVTAPMKGITSSAEKAQGNTTKLGDSLRAMSAIDLYAVSSSVGDLNRTLQEASAPGIAFDSQLKEVEAITGVAGSELDKLGQSARGTARIFGGDASAMMESYKAVLSRLGPDIAKNQTALEGMGVSIATLSKTMNNDAVGAMDALTTSVLQFGVDLSDPQHAANEMARMMHVMAAGAKQGASEVSQISQAVKQAGVQALSSKVSFEETNAALQALAQGGKTGSEAGVALRNVLGKMAGIDVVPRQAAEKLEALGVNYEIVADKTLPLTDRFRELAKAQGDATVMAQVFGVENAASAQILLRTTDYQDELREKITGTNVATEQADIIMSSYSEKISRMKAYFSDLGISIFGATQNILPFVDGLSGAVMVMANMANARKGIVMLMTTLKTMPIVGAIVQGGFGLMSMGAKMLGVAIMNIPIIGWIAAVIAGLIALGKYFWETSAEFRGVLTGVWEAVKTVFTGIGGFIQEVLEGIWHLIKGVFNPINWFDSDYSFSDGFDKITNAAKSYGESIGKAFQEGKAKGMESYYEEYPEEQPQGSEVAKVVPTEQKKITSLEKEMSPIVVPTTPLFSSGSKGDDKRNKLSGVGGADSGRSISQKIDIKNYFNVSSGTNVDEIAEKIIGIVNRKLRDALVTV